jgi:hypothetical protein
MKKLILLLLSVCVVALLGWYASGLMKQKGKSDTELIEFSIEDTTTVDKITITDAFSNKITLVKNGSDWMEEDGTCVTQENVHFILDAFKNIEFKGYLPEKSQEQFKKLMVSQHIKVEIFQEGEWTKTWYIGPAAQDHYGQMMLLDSYEYGKSDKPVMMKIKGLNGIIDPRFFADRRKWMCTRIFAVPRERIEKVEVTYFDDPVLSFSVTQKGQDLKVFQQGRPLKNVDTAMIYRYLNAYKKIHFELANFELDKRQLDSLKHSMPFATLKLSEKGRKTTKLRMFRIKSEEMQINDFGDVVSMDVNKFWCELPNGQVVKCQYFVFNPLIMGHVYFPMDISKRKKSPANPRSN